MGCLGVLFSLTPSQESGVLSQKGDSLIEFIQEEIESQWDEDSLVALDKSWDAIHRCLGNGTLFPYHFRKSAKAIIGGKQLYHGIDYIVSYKKAELIPAIVPALEKIDRKKFRKRYFALDKPFLGLDLFSYAGPIDEVDFEYSWSYFKEMREFYRQTLASNRAVLFSVDQ